MIQEVGQRTAAVIGAGSVGRELIDQLVESGSAVRVLVRNPRSFSHESPLVTVFEADVVDPISLCENFDGVDEVYNTAASFHHGATHGRVFKESYDVHVEGAENVLFAAETKDVPDVIYFSSEAVYGVQSEVDENSPLRCRGTYGVTKMLGEEATLANEYTVRRRVVRPVSILGPNADKWTELLYSRVASGQPIGLGNGSGMMRFVDIRDVAESAIEIARDPKTNGEVYNLTADNGIRMASLLEYFGKLADKNPRYIAAFLAIARSFAAERYSAITGEPIPVDTQMIQTGLDHQRRVSNQKIKDHIGYNFRPIEETITDSLLWINREHRLGKDEIIRSLHISSEQQ